MACPLFHAQQAIMLANKGLLLIGPLGTKLKILIKMSPVSYKKVTLKDVVSASRC